MNLRFFHPEIFQGNLKKNNYFEGWYFKHVSGDLNHVWSFIPGISLNKNDPHAFIQVIDGIAGKTEYVTYPLDQFTWDKNRLHLNLGNSVFTERYIDLDIKTDTLNISGRLEYDNMVKYPWSLVSPGIMGWYSFVPFMECKHGIVSVIHDLKGSIRIDEREIGFTGGKGYIEKDWGTSFPEVWIWIHANSFKEQNTSFHFSVAKIPWIRKFFVGFIAFLYYNKKFYLFSTHNKSSLSAISHTAGSISFSLKNHDSLLKVSVTKNTFGELLAPESGNMSRRIKESIDSEIQLELFDKHNNLIYSDSGKRAGLEVIEEIFKYI
jgi:hypothetical protein